MISSSARSAWDTASLPGRLGGRSAPAPSRRRVTAESALACWPCTQQLAGGGHPCRLARSRSTFSPSRKAREKEMTNTPSTAAPRTTQTVPSSPQAGTDQNVAALVYIAAFAPDKDESV